jgi:hypothetical protein
MGAEYYIADTENGDHLDDPSQDALSMMIEDLDQADNTFLTITPADPGAAWYASASRLRNNTYEVEYHDPRSGDHELTTQTERSKIAKDLTQWLARRHYPGKPALHRDF